MGAGTGLGSLLAACGGEAATSATAATSMPGTRSRPAPAQIQQIGQAAYPHGLQQVICTGERWMYTQNDSADNIAYAGLNRFFWIRKKITPDFPVVTPTPAACCSSAQRGALSSATPPPGG